MKEESIYLKGVRLLVKFIHKPHPFPQEDVFEIYQIIHNGEDIGALVNASAISLIETALRVRAVREAV